MYRLILNNLQHRIIIHDFPSFSSDFMSSESLRSCAASLEFGI